MKSALYVSVESSVCLWFEDPHVRTDFGTWEAVSKAHFTIREDEDVT
jgi:hypothetical protein